MKTSKKIIHESPNRSARSKHNQPLSSTPSGTKQQYSSSIETNPPHLSSNNLQPMFQNQTTGINAVNGVVDNPQESLKEIMNDLNLQQIHKHQGNNNTINTLTSQPKQFSQEFDSTSVLPSQNNSAYNTSRNINEQPIIQQSNPPIILPYKNNQNLSCQHKQQATTTTSNTPNAQLNNTQGIISNTHATQQSQVGQLNQMRMSSMTVESDNLQPIVLTSDQVYQDTISQRFLGQTATQTNCFRTRMPTKKQSQFEMLVKYISDQKRKKSQRSLSLHSQYTTATTTTTPKPNNHLNHMITSQQLSMQQQLQQQQQQLLQLSQINSFTSAQQNMLLLSSGTQLAAPINMYQEDKQKQSGSASTNVSNFLESFDLTVSGQNPMKPRESIEQPKTPLINLDQLFKHYVIQVSSTKPVSTQQISTNSQQLSELRKSFGIQPSSSNLGHSSGMNSSQLSSQNAAISTTTTTTTTATEQPSNPNTGSYNNNINFSSSACASPSRSKRYRKFSMRPHSSQNSTQFFEQQERSSLLNSIPTKQPAAVAAAAAATATASSSIAQMTQSATNKSAVNPNANLNSNTTGFSQNHRNRSPKGSPAKKGAVIIINGTHNQTNNNNNNIMPASTSSTSAHFQISQKNKKKSNEIIVSSKSRQQLQPAVITSAVAAAATTVAISSSVERIESPVDESDPLNHVQNSEHDSLTEISLVLPSKFHQKSQFNRLSKTADQGTRRSRRSQSQSQNQLRCSQNISSAVISQQQPQAQQTPSEQTFQQQSKRSRSGTATKLQQHQQPQQHNNTFKREIVPTSEKQQQQQQQQQYQCFLQQKTNEIPDSHLSLTVDDHLMFSDELNHNNNNNNNNNYIYVDDYNDEDEIDDECQQLREDKKRFSIDLLRISATASSQQSSLTSTNAHQHQNIIAGFNTNNRPFDQDMHRISRPSSSNSRKYIDAQFGGTQSELFNRNSLARQRSNTNTNCSSTSNQFFPQQQKKLNPRKIFMPNTKKHSTHQTNGTAFAALTPTFNPLKSTTTATTSNTASHGNNSNNSKQSNRSQIKNNYFNEYLKSASGVMASPSKRTYQSGIVPARGKSSNNSNTNAGYIQLNIENAQSILLNESSGILVNSLIKSAHNAAVAAGMRNIVENNSIQMHSMLKNKKQIAQSTKPSKDLSFAFTDVKNHIQNGYKQSNQNNNNIF